MPTKTDAEIYMAELKFEVRGMTARQVQRLAHEYTLVGKFKRSRDVQTAWRVLHPKGDVTDAAAH